MASVDNVAQLTVENDQEDFRRLTHMQRAMMRLRRDYLTQIALVVVILIILMAITAPITTELIGVNPDTNNLQATFAHPSSEHLLGTDNLGRDHLARLMYGARVSLLVAFLAAALSISIGVSMGMVTGFYGGVLDDVMIWFITTLNSIPTLFLLLMVSALFNPGPLAFVLILGFLGWTGTMRLVRGETLALREREYVIAARAMGASDVRIIFQHIFPNLVSIVIVALAIDVGVLILVESALSYLNVGISSSTPTWGNMLTDAQQFWSRSAILVIAPGLMIFITVLCMYLIGDGLRDALDPTVAD